jgi:hypothetical protein
MSDEKKSPAANDAARRLFLEKAGRFAVVTPPAVALMLSATGKARAAPTSGITTLITTLTTGSTVTRFTTTTVTVTTTSS